MNKTLSFLSLSLSLSLLAASPLTAATNFLARFDNNLNNVDNWDSLLPSASNAGTTTADGTLTADFGNQGSVNNAGAENFTINSTITTGAFTLSITGSGDRLFIGSGATGSLTVNSGGQLFVVGASQDVRIGFNNGNGILRFDNGSTIDTRKAVEVLNGTLSFGSAVTTGQAGIQNDFLIGSGGTLEFDIDGSFANHTIQGNSLNPIFDAGSTLQLNFAAAPTNGSTFKLIDDINTTAGYAGTFTNINASGLGSGQSISLTYGIGTDGLVATVIPEPSSTALLGLGALGFIIRRRR